jgi:uncharacterized protein YqhQ
LFVFAHAASHASGDIYAVLLSANAHFFNLLGACGLLMEQLMGGQAVVEGVLVYRQGRWAVAVRSPKGIRTLSGETRLLSGRLMRMPLLRGLVSLITMATTGFRAMSFAAQHADPDEETTLWMVIAALSLSVALALALFKLLPWLFASLLASRTDPLLFNALDGFFRVVLFVGYVVVISRFPDIQRLFEYHGAEHKVLNASQSAKPTLASARLASRFHAHCSTSFVVVVLLLAILLFALVPLSLAWWLVLLIRLSLLVPLVAVTYELVRFLTARSDNSFVRALLWPGYFVQRLTTREPDDDQLRVALKAFSAAGR